MNCFHRALANLAVVIVGALEQDNHVLLRDVVANPLHEAATVNDSAFEAVERDGAAVFDSHSLRCGGDGNRGTQDRY